ncbi:hypothetical protein HU200_050233 [Digitaria exilis]|uniref:Transmembrane protein n=1 Tax=Digitaria exilis TaxID=1010633 RepID=A0A835ARV9_9POAL|nr:hypothetical protein HU200_050233 [Digitaria exilis]CAB3473397.1 unnamed protein product [Digitaria exilis]
MAAAIRVVTAPVALASSALFLLTSAIAARRAIARGDAGDAALVVAAAVLVAALLAAVRAHDEAEGRRGRRRRGLLRAVVWAVSATLTAMFARRVAALVADPGVAALVWAMAGATVAGGFCCLFVMRGQDDDGVGHDARPA